MRGAHSEREVEAAIERSGVLRRGERVLVACSGGADSVALAAALHELSKRCAFELILAHVNHAVRESAWQDECVVLDVAARFALPVETIVLDGSAHDEQRLRQARYRALAGAAKRRGCSVVATAHHAQDQSETVLLALLRGTGPSGLSGMPVRRRLAAGIELARPLLRVEPAALRAYCHAAMLAYAVDPTNSQTDRRRNAVREALASLRPLFAGLDAAVARAAEVMADERGGAGRAALRRSVRERIAAENELRDVDFTHVEAAVRALENGRTGTFFMKPGIGLRIERGTIAGIITEE